MKIDAKIEEIRNYGFTSIPNLIDHSDLRCLLESVEPYLHLAENNYGTSKKPEITLAMFRTPSARRVMRDIIFNRALKTIISTFMRDPFIEHTKILVKPANGPETPWHQDGKFWHDFDPSKSMVSVWIALESTNIHNGCLEILKTKTRQTELIKHAKVRDNKEMEIPSECISDKLIDGVLIPIELNAGDALIFDSTTIHRALPNKLNHPRLGIKIVFQDQALRTANIPKHKSSIEMNGISGIINKTFPCAMTAVRLRKL